MPWLILVIISIVAGSVASILQRLLLKEEQSEPVTYGFVFQMIVFAILFAYALLAGGFVLPDLKPLALNLVLMTLFYALANLCLFKAFQTVEASDVAILMASRSIWTLATAALFLGEPFTVSKVIGTLIIIGGVVLLSWRKKKWNFDKGHIYILLAAILFGCAFTNDAYLINHFEVPSFTAFAFLLPGLAILAFRPSAVKKLSLFLDPKRLLKMLAASLFYGASALTIYFAYKLGGEASIIAPISQTSIILIVLFGYLFLKERNNLLNKLLGMITVFAGVVLLQI